MKISKLVNGEMSTKLDIAEATCIRDALQNYIPFVKVNDYFDEHQIGFLQKMIRDIDEALKG